MPVTSEGVTSSPGLEFGSLIMAFMEPPPGPVKRNGLPVVEGGGMRAPLVVLMEQTVLSTVAVKLPLLCAQAIDDPNKINATMARLVIIEQFFMILLFSCCFRPALEERLVNDGSPGTNTAPCPIKDPPCLLFGSMH